MILTDEENEYNYKNHHIMWHQDLNMVLYLTPKAGNSSLKKSILTGLGYDLCHEYPAGFKFVSPKNVYQLVHESNPDVIAFVRNPYTRILSCWADKMRKSDDPKPEGRWSSRYYSGMPFLEFLDIIDHTPWTRVNIHARSMVFEMMYYNEFLPNTVFKFEDFTTKSGWSVLEDYFKTKHGIPLYPLPHLNESSASRYVMNQQELKLIGDIYAADIKTFKYLDGDEYIRYNVA